MNVKDNYVFVNKKDITIFESMCILIINSCELFKNEDWFFTFLKNKLQKQLYIKFTKLNFKINQLEKNKL